MGNQPNNLIILILAIASLILAAALFYSYFYDSNGIIDDGATTELFGDLRVSANRIKHYSDNNTSTIYPHTYNDIASPSIAIDNYREKYVVNLAMGDLCTCPNSMCPWDSEDLDMYGVTIPPEFSPDDLQFINILHISGDHYRVSPNPNAFEEITKKQITLLKINGDTLNNVFLWVQKNEILIKLSNADLEIIEAK